MRLACPQKPHFFQPLLPDFLTKFSMPKNFRKHLGGDTHDEREGGTQKKIDAKLRDNGGGTWNVKVDPDTLRFIDGWEKFCKDHDLQIGYFLVFKYKGKWIFDVRIFDHSTCEREFPTVPKKKRVRKKIVTSDKPKSSRTRHAIACDGKDCPRKTASFKPSAFPHFHVDVTPYCFNCGSCFIPMNFGKENGLTKRWCDMEMINEKGESWTLKLRHMNKSRENGGNPYICGGWSALLKANRLNTGDHLIIELLDSGVKPIMKLYTCDEDPPVTDTGTEVTEAKVS